MQGFTKWSESKYWPSAEGYEQYLLKGGDIVMAMDRPCTGEGFKMAFVDSSNLPAILIQRTACIRARDLENGFLYTMLNSGWFAKHCNIKGSLVPHISNKDINAYEVFVPPIDLQKQFAEFYQQIDKSKFVVQKSLQKTQLLFDKLMQEYFG